MDLNNLSKNEIASLKEILSNVEKNNKRAEKEKIKEEKTKEKEKIKEEKTKEKEKIKEEKTKEQEIKSEETNKAMTLCEFEAISNMYEYEIGTKVLGTFANKPFDKDLLDYLSYKFENVFLRNNIMVVVDENISMDSFSKKEKTRDKALEINKILKFNDISVLNKLLPRILNYVETYKGIIFSNTNKKGYINLWRENDILETEAKGFEHIEFLIKHIFSEESYDFAISYINSIVNYFEHDKVPVISSFEGMGKGVFRRLIGFLTHESRVYEDRPTIFTAQFNEQLFGKGLVVINEIGRTEFTKVKDTLKDLTGKEVIEIRKKFLDAFVAPRTQQYMIFTNKNGIENFLDESQRRFVIIDNNNNDKKKLNIAVMNEYGITVEEFIIKMKEELFNFKEHLRKKRVECTYTSIDKTTINLINKSDNFAIRFLKALGTNNVEEGNELLRKYKEYSSEFVDDLFHESHNGNYISTTLINDILLTIQPTFNSRHQLLKEPYKSVIDEYFNIHNNRKNVLKINGNHTKHIIKCDKVTKRVFEIKPKVHTNIEEEFDNSDIWE